MSDTYVEVKHTSWWDRMMSSIGGVVVGIALFFCAFPVLIWNEYNTLQTGLAIDEANSVVVRDVKSDTVDAANNGKLIHTSGEAKDQEPARDETLGISLPAIRLVRKVEMYQWHQEEKTEKQGNKEVTRRTYDKQWSESFESSKDFKEPGYDNPKEMLYHTEQFYSPKVTVGALGVSPEIVKKIDGEEPVRWSDELYDRLGNELKNSSKMTNDYVYFRPNATVQSIDPETPLIGDYRISLAQVPPHPVTVVAEQRDGILMIWKASNGYDIAQVASGTVTVEGMFQAMRSSADLMTWILRAVGAVMLIGGINLIFAPIATAADWIPFLGEFLKAGVFLFALGIGLALAFLTIAVAWVAVRPLIGIGLIVLAIALIFGVRALAGMFSSPAAPAQQPQPQPVR